MITTAPTRDPQRKRDETLSRFIREYIYKVAQVIVAARRVSPRSPNNTNHSLSESWNDLNAPYSQWFRVETNDSQQVQQYIEEECIANWDAKHSDFTLTIDISLSAEPLSEHVLLERWRIKFKRQHANLAGNSGEKNDASLMYKRMSIQIRSILSYLRLLPTHCIVQSWEQAMTEQSMLMNVSGPSPQQRTQHHSHGHHHQHLHQQQQYGQIASYETPPHQQQQYGQIASYETPFALYHLIYSHHNKQDEQINNFSGDTKSFSFAPLKSKFGTIRTTVFYGKNIRKDFEWLIRSVPGKNPPLEDDNLSKHIDSRSRYWDKREVHEQQQQQQQAAHVHTDDDDDEEEQSRHHQRQRKNINKLSKHFKHRTSPSVHANAANSNNSPNFELIQASPEQLGINTKAFVLDEQMASIVKKQSPPIKSLAIAANNHFHESPVLATSTPKLDPQKEMERIRLSTIFGSAPPVISLADVSTIKDRDAYGNGMQYASGSQLLDSIVREKQVMATTHGATTRKHSKITILKTLRDIEHADNGNAMPAGDIFGDVAKQLDESIDSSDMNCDDSDHDDMQEEIFEGYDDDDLLVDDKHSKHGQKQMAKISEFINLCSNAHKTHFTSFESKDELLLNTQLLQLDDEHTHNHSQLSKQSQQQENSMSDSHKYFKLLSKQFEIRQQRLIQLKKTSSLVLSHSVMKK
eukprot:CAMPEP_0197073694 /NCGR_PEP_ID=MMETSP1384-20130603/210737_1 /TAXON_ID=29189 /ORGANISM="Ammonia sp." /LENGTH=690 /DNA_ID=CAMNT_0042512533 /DNA_START=18 /DNA_END=2091 /DNA_ORIENTATION=-